MHHFARPLGSWFGDCFGSESASRFRVSRFTSGRLFSESNGSLAVMAASGRKSQ